MLKKEIRILGLSAAPERNEKIPVVGVIFRGNLWLDGAFACILKKNHRNCASALAKTIMQTKQYSQLHAVIMSSEYSTSQEVDIVALANKIKLAVITVVKDGGAKPGRTRNSTGSKRASKLRPYTFKIENNAVHIQAAGISGEMAYEILRVSCPRGSHVPEAVRVAKVLAKHASLVQDARNQMGACHSAGR